MGAWDSRGVWEERLARVFAKGKGGYVEGVVIRC